MLSQFSAEDLKLFEVLVKHIQRKFSCFYFTHIVHEKLAIAKKIVSTLFPIQFLFPCHTQLFRVFVTIVWLLSRDENRLMLSENR